MDFEEFRDKLAEELGERLYEKTGDSFTFEKTHVDKLQNAGYDGIVIRREDSEIGMNFDCSFLFGKYQNGMPFDEVVDAAEKIVTDGFQNTPNINVDDLMNYDVMKERLAVQVVATERNADMLANIPHITKERSCIRWESTDSWILPRRLVR